MSSRKHGWFEEKLVEFENDPEFLTGELLLEINEQLCRLMEEQGVSRAQLAKRLGCSRAHITQILNGMPNISLQKLVRLADALEARVGISVSRPQRARTSGRASATADARQGLSAPCVPQDSTVLIRPHSTLAQRANRELPFTLHLDPQEDFDASALAA